MLTNQNTYDETMKRQQCDALVLENLHFVRHVLGKTVAHLPDHVDLENLEAAGVLGLVEAAQHFDPARGVSFTTFAYRRIRGAILDELRRNSPLPQRVFKLISIVRKACEQLETPITPDMIVDSTGLTLAEVESAIEAMRLQRMQSGEESSFFISDLLDARAECPDEKIEQREIRDLMIESLQHLPKNERLVITLYYLEDLRLREIGELLNLSESRISRLLSRAEFALNQLMRRSCGYESPPTQSTNANDGAK